MIREQKPLTYAEVKELLKDLKTEKAQALLTFLKKFIKLSAAEALKLKEELVQLGIAKLKEEHLVELINFTPKDASDVRKIFTGSELNLDQNEIEKILSVFRKK